MKKFIAVFSLVLLNLSTQGCGGSSSATEPTELKSLYEDLADNVILPNYRSAVTAAEALSGNAGAIQQYCDAIGTASEDTQRDLAQSAWMSAMVAWQRTELHKFGPVLANSESLQNRVLSYVQGVIDSCGVDASVVSAQTVGFDLATKSSNQKGLGSIEYTLFNTDLTHTCPAQITQTSDWDARPEQERKEWRCDFARLVADDVSDAIATVTNEWEVSGENYRAVFVNPLNSAVVLGKLSDGLFYMDTVTKDKKIGLPMGILSSCSQPSCPQQLESFYSETSLANIKANLESFKQLLTGNGGLGLEALIQDADVPEVTDRLLQAADDAIAEIDAMVAMSVSAFDQAIAIVSASEEAECTNAVASPETMSNFPACNLYGHIKKISDELKSGFVAAIGASIPQSAQADND